MNTTTLSSEAVIGELCADACYVQDACNASGVIYSFAAMLKDGMVPSDPVAVMFASKLCSLASQYISSDEPAQHGWDGMVGLCDDVTGLMSGLDTAAKNKLELFQTLANDLSVLTKCHEHEVLTGAFEYCYEHATWSSFGLKADFGKRYGIAVKMGVPN